MNEEFTDEDIDYQTLIDEMPCDLELISNGQFSEYANKQCLIMCEYIQRVRGFEILSMFVEFFRDENDFMWFYYAKDIHIRKSLTRTGMSNAEAKKKAQKIRENKAKAKRELIAELEKFESTQKAQRNQAVSRMMGLMSDYYIDLKKKEGIDDQFLNMDKNTEITRLEDIMKKIRPNCKANNFKEYLNQEGNQSRTMEWRKIQRMMDPDVEFDKKPRFNDKQLAVKQLVEALKDKIRSEHHPMISEPKQL